MPPPEITEAERLPAEKRRMRKNHWTPSGGDRWPGRRDAERVIEYRTRAKENQKEPLPRIKPRANVSLQPDGRLAITTWYAEPARQGISTACIRPGESYLGVPYYRWNQHRDRKKDIDLAGWRGNGPGMRGGPRRITYVARSVDWFTISGVSQAEEMLVSLKAMLSDPRIHYVGQARESMLADIRAAEEYLCHERGTPLGNSIPSMNRTAPRRGLPLRVEDASSWERQSPHWPTVKTR